MSKWYSAGALAGVLATTCIAETTSEARFRVLPMVVAENPGAYTFTVAEGPVNALLKCGNFEPISLRTKWHALADSPNDIRIDRNIMSYYDSKHTGFYDGAKVRIYRVRNGKLMKVREDRVKEYVVEDWNYGVEGLYAGKLVAPSATQASTHIAEWSRKGCDAWFAVVAVNKDGNRSPVSNAVRIQIPEDYPSTPTTPQNRIAPQRIPWKPVGATVPGAPSNFRAQLNPATGEIRMKWDAVSDPNLIGYQIAKTDYNPATHRGNHIYLETSPADPAQHIKTDDLIFVDHEILEFDRDKMMSNRVLDAIPEQIKQPYFKDTPTRRWKLEPHSADAPEELKHSGRTCVRIEVEDSEELALRKHNHAGLKQNWYPVLDPEKTYVVEFWAKHDGLAKPSATFRLDGPLEDSFQPLEYPLSNDWKKTYRRIPRGGKTAGRRSGGRRPDGAGLQWPRNDLDR